MAPNNQYDETLADLRRASPVPAVLGAPTAAPATPLEEQYRETLRQRTELRASQLRVTMQQAVTQTPERAARAAQLAARVGLPLSVVERNFDAIEQRARVEETEYTRLLKETPTLAAWLVANPSHAAVAQAEIPQLSQVERVLRTGIDIRRGIDQVLGLSFSAAEWLGEATGAEGLRATGRAGRELSALSAAQYGPAAEFTDVRSVDDFARWMRDVVGDQIPILAVTAPSAYAGAALGTMILPGIGTTIGAAIGAFVPSLVLGIGEVQQGVKERGEDQSAPTAVFLGGSAIAAFDSALPRHIGSRMLRVFGRETAEQVARKVLLMPVKQSMLREAGKELATEGFTEALQEAIGQAATDIGTGVRFDPFDPDLWRRMINAGAAGALVGGVAGGGGRVIEDTVDRKARQAAAAQYGGNVLNSITAALKDTEIAARLPGAVESFVASATQGGALETVYAPVEFWTEYWQSHQQDPAAFAALVTGDPKAYETAVATGQELVIPLARYAMAIGVTEHHAAFLPEIRWRPGEMNMREAAAWQLEQAAAAPAGPATDPHTEAHTAFVAQLVRAGYTPEVAEQHAVMQEAILRRLGARAGTDPAALYKMFGLEVTRPGVNLESDATLGLSPSAVPVQPVAPPISPEGLASGHMPAGPTVQPVAGGAPMPVAPLESLAEPAAAEPAAPAGERRGPARVETPETDTLYANMRAALETQQRAGLDPEQVALLDELFGRTVDMAPAVAQTEQEGTPDDTGTEGLRADAGAPGRPAVRRIDESTPLVARESARARESRRTQHYAAVFNEVKRAAKALDPTVDVKTLRKEFNDRVEMLEELDQEWAASGHNPRRVLQAIADAGGISIDFESKMGGLAGELRWIKESKAFGPFGAFAGVRGVFRQHQSGARAGTQRTGLSLDDMARALNSQSEFAWVESLYDLHGILEDIARLEDPSQLGRTANFPGTEELRRRAGVNPAIDWWRHPDEQQFFQAEQPAGAPIVDVLDTGEEQPRLPGADGARQVGEADTRLRAPVMSSADFALEAEGAREIDDEQFELFQSAPAGPIFYSRLTRAVEAVSQNKASGAQWKAMIRNAKIGVNQDEFAYARVDDLENDTTYTKEQILNYLRANLIDIEDVTLSGPGGPTDEQLEHRASELLQAYIDEQVNEFEPELEEYAEPSARYNDEEEQWEAFVDDEDVGEYYDSEEQAMEVARDVADQRRLEAEEYRRESYREQLEDRWDISDFMREAHIEFDGDDVEPGVQFASYVEPGVHHDYREVFLTVPGVHSEPVEQPAAFRFGSATAPAPSPLTWVDGHTEYDDIQNPVVRLRFDTRATSAGKTLFLEEVQTPQPDEFATMPALLQKNWRPLSFKWALRYAADHGFDAIAWTTGEQQAARYSLEKEVKEIVWRYTSRYEDAGRVDVRTVGITLLNRRGEIQFDIGPDGRVRADGVSQAAEAWVGAPLEVIVGKEMADKILAEPAGDLAGEGLKVGGEGLKRLYDVDFKNVVNNLQAVKKHGGRVTTVTLQRSDTEQPALIITDELRDAVLGGQTLFQGAKLDADGRYQANLFGEPLEDGADVQPAAALQREDGAGAADVSQHVQSAAALQRDDVEGTFSTRTELVTARPQQLGASQVTTPQHAANALSYLSTGAQERFDVLVTDAVGTPLAVVGAFKGRVDEAHAYPDVVVAEAFRIQGAAAIWLAHNHPSGDPTLSREDRFLSGHFARLFADTAIAMKGMLAFGEDAFMFFDPVTGTQTAPASFAAEPGGPVVPVLERAFTAREKLSADPIERPGQAVAAAQTHANGEFGVLLLDTTRKPIGFLPIDPFVAGRLRQDNRLDWFYRALSISGAAAAVVHAPRDIGLARRAASNLANALHTVGVAPIDIVVENTSTMQAAGGALRLTGQFQQDKRGSIRFGRGREFKVSLFEKADFSTLIHELGHFYLEIFGDLVDQVRALDPATLTAEQRELVADYDAMLKGLGVTTRAEVGVDQHEQFARLFEAYLWTGKAPSPELRSAFASFKIWLREVYASLKQLGVTLTPEVSAIFDRMLASDEAIAAAEAEGGLAPMFTDARSAGMSEAEFANYRKTIQQASTAAREQLDRQLLADVRRERTAAWQAQRAEVRDKVADDVQRMPVYQALFAMQKGTYPNGAPIVTDDGAAPARVSRQAVVAQFNRERARTLPRGVLTNGPGLDPQTAADLYGFASGDAFLRALATARPMETVIEEETDRRMREEHGGILLDATLIDRAQAASANEAREKIARAELAALDKQRRQVRPHVQTAVRDVRREQAYERRWLEAEAKLRIAIAEGRKQVEIDRLRADMETIQRQAAGAPAQIRAALPPAALVRGSAVARVAATKIRDLQPHLFWAAALRANKTAIDAAARQDLDVAIAAQQQYLVNLALYREATKQLEDVARRVEAAKALGTVAARKRLGLADQSYLDQVDGILDRFEFATVSRTVLDRRANILKWVAALEGENLPVDLPELVLEEARRVNYRELTVDELVAVTDGLQQIVHLAQLKTRLLKGQQGRALHAVASDLAASIRANTSKRRDVGLQAREPKDGRARLMEGIFAAHRKMSSLAYQLDGFVDGGPMATAIMFPLNEAGSMEAAMNADATQRLSAIVERAYPGKEKATLYVKHDLPAVGKSLPKMTLLMVALNWGNEGNRQRIRSGYTLSDAQIMSMLDTLDARDWRFVQDIWDFLDSYWLQIKAKQERVFGVAPEKVPAAPFMTRFGMMRGGYFMLRYDDTLSPAAAQNVDLEGVSFQRQAAYVNATTKRGHTEARAEKVTLPVLLDFRVITDHVRQVVHDLSHHEALIDVGRVLGHKLVQQAIYETYGDQVYRQFTTGVRDVAQGDKPAANGFERAINHVRVGTTVAGLGWSLTTALLQPLGLTQSMSRIGTQWVGVGLKRWLRDSAHMENTVVWISDKSEFMRTRFLTQQRELNEIKNQVGVNTGKLSGWVDEALSKTTFDVVTRQGLADSYFYLIGVMQRVADVPTWIGQYEKSMAAGETEERAILIADQAVLDAQAGGQTKDLAAVQRGGPMMKLWTNFYSFFSATYNLAAEARAKRKSLKQPAELGRLAVDYLLLFTIPATLGYLVRAIMGGRAGDEEDWLEALARENVSYMMGSLLGLRELSGAVSGYGYRGPAGARVFASGSNLVQQIGQGEIDEGLIRALNDTAGALFHYPAGQAWRSLTGLAAIVEGKTTNPGALVVGPPAKE